MYQFVAPFILTLRGYTVVAPDYAGLGVSQDYNNQPIRHAYAASPAQADDLFYAVQAAQSAFPNLSKNFVLMGHSQGGGVAWAAAQRQATRPVPGYLGVVAASPLTNAYDFVRRLGQASAFVPVLVANGLRDLVPGFDVGTVLTPAGVGRYDLVAQIGGCESVYREALADEGLVVDGWWDSPHATELFNSTANGGRALGEPMLVLQGTADTTVPIEMTDSAVNATCAAYPDSRLEYVTYPGVDHVPTMFASQGTWVDWIADRFAGVPVKSRCREAVRVATARPVEEYQPELNWFLEFAREGYQT